MLIGNIFNRGITENERKLNGNEILKKTNTTFVIPLVESVSWRWFDFELLQFAHYRFVPGWKHAVFRVVWFLLLLQRCWKLYKKKKKGFSRARVSQIGVRSGGSHPSYPGISHISPHSMRRCSWTVSLWTQSWLQRPPTPGGSCSLPSPGQAGKQTPGRLSQDHLFMQTPCCP